MRRNRSRTVVVVALPILIAAVVGTLLYGGDERIDHYTEAGRPPRISPDYGGIRIPYNIAPLNFVIEEPGRRYQVWLRAGDESVVVSSSDPGIRIPLDSWRALLGRHRGEDLRIDVFADGADRGWKRYDSLVDRISEDPIDPYLVYRDIYPQFYVKKYMCIKERHLEDFEERRLMDDRQFPTGGCFNCHTFLNHRGDRFALQVRYQRKGYLLLSDHGETRLVRFATRKPGAAYLAWHPSGKAIAVAINMQYRLINWLSGVVPEEVLEFGDLDGDIGVYHLASNRLTKGRSISLEDRMESHPEWSPDGKYLYFVSSPKVPIEEYEKVMYDLRRVSYDIDTDQWGESETLVSAADTGRSCSFPKVSPDGRFVLFGMSDRSSLTLLRDETDLCLMELAGKSWWKPGINSDRSDSYHCWASDSRWIGFVSKRRDGVHGLVYFSHVDEDGEVSKPFVLPQRDPAFYESFVRTFNVPEFLTEPVEASRFALGAAATDIERLIRSD